MIQIVLACLPGHATVVGGAEQELGETMADCARLHSTKAITGQWQGD